METQKKFIPDLAGCGTVFSPVAMSSVQKPVSEFGRTHLLLRSVSEFYTAFNRAHWGPFPKACFPDCLRGGQAGFLFDLVEDGCYRAIFKTQRYREEKGTTASVWFHVHEMGIIDHVETTHGGYQIFTVELGRLTAQGGLWHLCLNVETNHPENMFAFFEAYLEKSV